MKNYKEKNKAIIAWLLSGCVLIFIMVVVGGITRLTHSGLSIVNWNLIMGTLPPLNEAQWQEAFEAYQQFPEYQLVNYHFSLQEFKSIFFWEYLHRLIGRVIGLVFIIPFAIFLIRKQFSRRLLWQCLVILGMGALQGFLGWWMVKSGLVKNPDVDHVRLAIHLTTAFLTFAVTFWVALEQMYPQRPVISHSGIRQWSLGLLVVLLVQIVYGAFVAGLNAGFILNTWPMMGDAWVHPAVFALQPWWANLIDGLAGVQFVHRYLAYVAAGLALVVWYLARKRNLSLLQHRSVVAMVVMVVLQFLLGVFTLLYAVPVVLGVLHQAAAFLLLGNVVLVLFAFRKAAKNSPIDERNIKINQGSPQAYTV
jgi:cytochrome c oxidase assembly protein subunit 15